MIVNTNLSFKKEGGSAFLVDQQGLSWATDEAKVFLSEADNLLKALDSSYVEPDEVSLRGAYESGSAYVLDSVEARTRAKLEKADFPLAFKGVCGKLARQSVPESQIRSVDEARAAAKEQARLLPAGARPGASDLTVIEGRAALSSEFWKRLREHFCIEVPEEVLQMASDTVPIINSLRYFADAGYDLCSSFGGESVLSQLARTSALPEDRPGVTEADAVIALMRGKSRTPDEKRQLLHRDTPKGGR